MPVKLPIEIKTDSTLKSDDFTKVKIKSEPMDTDEVKGTVKGQTHKIGKDDMFKEKAEEKPMTCSELFTNPIKSGKCIYCS